MNTEELNNSEYKQSSIDIRNKIMPNKVPVASSSGNGDTKLNDNIVVTRRKRVRISTNIRTKQDKSHERIKIHQAPIKPDKESRKTYEEEYHRNRSIGNYSSKSYNPNNFGENYDKSRVNANRANNLKDKSKRRPNHTFPEPIKFQEELPDDMEIRINKYIANSGICSRREADIMIEKGKVTVNGVVITELGTRVRPIDRVECEGKLISVESKVYILLNKPKNCVTTLDDPQGRLTVMDIVKNACSERIYPVGRLDRNTVGVLLLTNDGELATKLTHPSFMKKKIYHVWLNKPVSHNDMKKIIDGIELEDGEIHADALSYVKEDDKRQVGIEIHSGRNRIVRRIFEHLGYRVVKLDRVYFSGLTKKNLPRGKWRFLDKQEVINLRNGLFE